MLRLVLLNTVKNGLEERLSNEVTVYAENHRIRVAETKAGCGCRSFSQYLVIWLLVLDTSRCKLMCTGDKQLPVPVQ